MTWEKFKKFQKNLKILFSNFKVIIEKTPAYFTANPQVPQRVFQFNPKIKFILIVRSPVTRTGKLKKIF